MNISFTHDYTSIACNRAPDTLDWNSKGVICYAANNAVALYDTTQRCGDSVKILCHHKSKVNSVKWLLKPDGTSTEFVSCSADKTAAIWTLCDGVYKVTSCMVGHSDGITSIAGIYTEGDNITVYTASIDSTIKVWERINGTLTFKQTISLNSGLCLTLHTHILPKLTKPVLFAALDDHKIHIFGEALVPGEAGDVVEYHRLHTLVGHEDWVRGLDVLDVDSETVLLASCSQDTYVRLWRIQTYVPEMDDTPGIKVERRVLCAHGRQYSVQLDAVLAGHEGWVYGVHWARTINKTYRLLSSSLDKTLIMWEPEGGRWAGAWAAARRLGEAGGGGAGFYGGRALGTGQVVAHSYTGSLHRWLFDEATGEWQPQVVVGGHYGPVSEVSWEARRGRYLLSVSADQTTRLHAPWNRDDLKPTWHELARPQIHGYDMSSVASVNSSTFVSAAEEKVLRVFSAPHNFLQNYENVTGEPFCDGAEVANLPEGASVPSLGLSNKAVFLTDDGGETGNDDDGYFVPQVFTKPPTEESIIQCTLWAERCKLYGHGHDVVRLAAAPDSTLLASAARATGPEHAYIIIWDTSNWQEIQRLPSHQLTVTHLAFSPDSQHLLSVSRDRRWTLFRRREGGNLFDRVAGTDNSNGQHKRIIWCCDWSHDGEMFATGSRDGKVCIWSKTGTPTDTSLGEYGLHTLIEVKTSVTALAFMTDKESATHFLVVGVESGELKVYRLDGNQASLVKELDQSAAHHAAVRRLSVHGDRLASCGDDHLVRIYTLATH